MVYCLVNMLKFLAQDFAIDTHKIPQDFAQWFWSIVRASIFFEGDFILAMESEGEKSDQPILLNPRRQSLETPKKREVFDKIDREHDEYDTGRTVDELRMAARRKPNELMRCTNRYNTDRQSQLDDSDVESLRNFVVPEDEVEEEEDDDDDGDSGNGGDNNDAVEISDDGNEDEPMDEPIVNTRKRRPTRERIESDVEEEEDDDEEQAPIASKRSRRSNRPVINSQSPERTESPAYPMLEIPSASPRRCGDLDSSDPEDDKEDDGALAILKCPGAPKKRRRSADDDETSHEFAPRQSSRIAAALQQHKAVRKRLFDPLKKDREAKEARRVQFAELASRRNLDVMEVEEMLDDFEEESAEEDDDDHSMEISENRPAPVTITSNQPSAQESKAEKFHSIATLDLVPDSTYARPSLVNIIGFVVDYGHEMNASMGQPLRQITVQDESNETVKVTLWREHVRNPAVKQGAYLAMFSLKKTTFRDRPQLATFYARIEARTPPRGLSQDSLAEFKPSTRSLVIEYVDAPLIRVYHACAKCHLSKVEQIFDENGDVRYECRKCHASYEVEETHVAVVATIGVHDEGESDTQPKLVTMFTSSVRKLCPDLPKMWDGGASWVEMRDQIVDRLNSAPVIVCRMKGEENVEILKVKAE